MGVVLISRRPNSASCDVVAGCNKQRLAICSSGPRCICDSLRSWRDFARECFCCSSEAVNTSGEAVRGLVKSEFHSRLRRSRIRQGENMAALPLARSRIPPATQATSAMDGRNTKISVKCKSSCAIFNLSICKYGNVGKLEFSRHATAGLPAKFNLDQLRRQTGSQFLGQILILSYKCSHIPQWFAVPGMRHLRTSLSSSSLRIQPPFIRFRYYVRNAEKDGQER